MWNKILKQKDEQLKRPILVSFFYIYYMIKNWKSFLESQQLDLFEPYRNFPTGRKPKKEHLGIFIKNEESLLDDLIDFDENSSFIIDINYGFLVEEGVYYDERIKSRTESPCISVAISVTDGVNNKGEFVENMTPSFKTFINQMKRIFKRIDIFDDNNQLDINKIRIDNGYIGVLLDNGEVEVIDGNLFILLIQDEESFTDKMIMDYYGFTNREDITYDEKGNALISFRRKDLADLLLDPNTDYRDVIDSNEYDLLDLYDNPDFYPEDESMLRYNLDIDTIVMLIEKIIKVYNIINIYHDVAAFEGYSNLEEAIQGISRRNKWRELGNFLSDFDLYNELKSIWSDWESQQKADQDYESIMDSFDKIVTSNLETSIEEKFFKEEEIYKNGKKFNDHVPYYRIVFNFNWFSDVDDSDLLKTDDLYEILNNNNYEGETLNPYFRDYASVDRKEFNKEAKAIISNSNKP